MNPSTATQPTNTYAANTQTVKTSLTKLNSNMTDINNSDRPCLIIIGGTSGVGLALAITHLKLGWHVIVVGSRSVKIMTLNQIHPDLVTLQCDITDSHQRQRLFEQLSTYRFQRLIYSAGWYLNERRIHLNQADSSHMLSVNLQAFHAVFHWASDQLKAQIMDQVQEHPEKKEPPEENDQQENKNQKQDPTATTHSAPTLICIASIAGMMDYPYASLYAKCKRAMIATATAYRSSLTPFGIQVNCIAMGYVNTEALRQLNDGDASHKPFIIEEALAVQYIMQAIDQNSELAVFPKQMCYLTKVLNTLPAPLLNWLMRRKLDKKAK